MTDKFSNYETRLDQEMSDLEANAFMETGYVRLGRIASSSELVALRSRIDDIMLGNVKYDQMPMQLDSETGKYGDVPGQTLADAPSTLAYRRIDELWRDPVFLGYMQQPLFKSIAARFIGTEVSVFRAMFMNKPAHRGTELPWHQDVGAGWGLDANPITTIWTAMDDATRDSGCMQLAPGSHKAGVLSERHFPTEEQITRHAPPAGCIHLEAVAGEAILLHNFLLHRSPVNTSDQPRRAFSVPYMNASVKDVQSGRTFPVVFGEQALIPEEQVANS
ncbi:MAG: phytanoyl-CoA dioxygenase [Candidatus Latescibacteria bacterium]|nr:phytanoyl-CoA dioxygenase [Candidatus Latescibacterota bacterium]